MLPQMQLSLYHGFWIGSAYMGLNFYHCGAGIMNFKTASNKICNFEQKIQQCSGVCSHTPHSSDLKSQSFGASIATHSALVASSPSGA